MGGTAGAGYQYGRLEIFLRGFWSNICNADVFSPAAAAVACAALGFDGGAALEFYQPYNGDSVSLVRLPIQLNRLPPTPSPVERAGDK